MEKTVNLKKTKKLNKLLDSILSLNHEKMMENPKNSPNVDQLFKYIYTNNLCFGEILNIMIEENQQILSELIKKSFLCQTLIIKYLLQIINEHSLEKKSELNNNSNFDAFLKLVSEKNKENVFNLKEKISLKDLEFFENKKKPDNEVEYNYVNKHEIKRNKRKEKILFEKSALALFKKMEDGDYEVLKKIKDPFLLISLNNELVKDMKSNNKNSKSRLNNLLENMEELENCLKNENLDKGISAELKVVVENLRLKSANNFNFYQNEKFDSKIQDIECYLKNVFSKNLTSYGNKLCNELQKINFIEKGDKETQTGLTTIKINEDLFQKEKEIIILNNNLKELKLEKMTLKSELELKEYEIKDLKEKIKNQLETVNNKKNEKEKFYYENEKLEQKYKQIKEEFNYYIKQQDSMENKILTTSKDLLIFQKTMENEFKILKLETGLSILEKNELETNFNTLNANDKIDLVYQNLNYNIQEIYSKLYNGNSSFIKNDNIRKTDLLFKSRENITINEKSQTERKNRGVNLNLQEKHNFNLKHTKFEQNNIEIKKNKKNEDSSFSKIFIRVESPQKEINTFNSFKENTVIREEQNMDYLKATDEKPKFLSFYELKQQKKNFKNIDLHKKKNKKFIGKQKSEFFEKNTSLKEKNNKNIKNEISSIILDGEEPKKNIPSFFTKINIIKKETNHSKNKIKNLLNSKNKKLSNKLKSRKIKKNNLSINEFPKKFSNYNFSILNSKKNQTLQITKHFSIITNFYTILQKKMNLKKEEQKLKKFFSGLDLGIIKEDKNNLQLNFEKIKTGHNIILSQNESLIKNHVDEKKDFILKTEKKNQNNKNSNLLLEKQQRKKKIKKDISGKKLKYLNLSNNSDSEEEKIKKIEQIMKKLNEENLSKIKNIIIKFEEEKIEQENKKKKKILEKSAQKKNLEKVRMLNKSFLEEFYVEKKNSLNKNKIRFKSSNKIIKNSKKIYISAKDENFEIFSDKKKKKFEKGKLSKTSLSFKLKSVSNSLFQNNEIISKQILKNLKNKKDFLTNKIYQIIYTIHKTCKNKKNADYDDINFYKEKINKKMITENIKNEICRFVNIYFSNNKLCSLYCDHFQNFDKYVNIFIEKKNSDQINNLKILNYIPSCYES